MFRYGFAVIAFAGWQVWQGLTDAARRLDGCWNPTRHQLHEDPDRLGYHLMAGGSAAPPRPRRNDPLLDIAPEHVWRDIERDALS